MLLLLLRRFFIYKKSSDYSPFYSFLRSLVCQAFVFRMTKRYAFSLSLFLSFTASIPKQKKGSCSDRGLRRCLSRPIIIIRHLSFCHIGRLTADKSRQLSLFDGSDSCCLSLSLLVLLSLLVRQLSYFRPMLGCQIRKPVKQWI